MTVYDLMIKTNHYLIQGGGLTETQKSNIVRQLLLAKSSPSEAQRFYSGVKYPDSAERDARRIYPFYYIPPYNGNKKYKTIFYQTPKTHIFSANMYELEILRLLKLLAPGLQDADDMIAGTLKRLKTTCFGFMDDGVGECFDASLAVLRFLAAAAPGESAWIKSRIENYNRHYAEKKRSRYCLWYYWLCLSELPLETVKPELDKYKSEMLNLLEHKSHAISSEQSRTIHPVLLCILRNNIARYPEYEYIKERKPYVNENNGRLYFDMTQPPEF